MQAKENYELLPDFAIICSFLERFSSFFGSDYENLSIKDFKSFLEAEKVDPSTHIFCKLHWKLCCAIDRKDASLKWEKLLIKFCKDFPERDDKIIVEKGYCNIPIPVKLRIFKNLCEDQFEYNDRFNSRVNAELLEEGGDFRHEPLGKDRLGRQYFFLQDKEMNLRLYRSWRNDVTNEETWNLVSSDVDELKEMIEVLQSTEEELKQEDPVLPPTSESLPREPVSKELLQPNIEDVVNAFHFASVQSPLLFKAPKLRTREEILRDEKKYKLRHCYVSLQKLHKTKKLSSDEPRSSQKEKVDKKQEVKGSTREKLLVKNSSESVCAVKKVAVIEGTATTVNGLVETMDTKNVTEKFTNHVSEDKNISNVDSNHDKEDAVKKTQSKTMYDNKITMQSHKNGSIETGAPCIHITKNQLDQNHTNSSQTVENVDLNTDVHSTSTKTDTGVHSTSTKNVIDKHNTSTKTEPVVNADKLETEIVKEEKEMTNNKSNGKVSETDDVSEAPSQDSDRKVILDTLQDLIKLEEIINQGSQIVKDAKDAEITDTKSDVANLDVDEKTLDIDKIKLESGTGFVKKEKHDFKIDKLNLKSEDKGDISQSSGKMSSDSCKQNYSKESKNEGEIKSSELINSNKGDEKLATNFMMNGFLNDKPEIRDTDSIKSDAINNDLDKCEAACGKDKKDGLKTQNSIQVKCETKTEEIKEENHSLTKTDSCRSQNPVSSTSDENISDSSILESNTDTAKNNCSSLELSKSNPKIKKSSSKSNTDNSNVLKEPQNCVNDNVSVCEKSEVLPSVSPSLESGKDCSAGAPLFQNNTNSVINTPLLSVDEKEIESVLSSEPGSETPIETSSSPKPDKGNAKEIEGTNGDNLSDLEIKPGEKSMSMVVDGQVVHIELAECDDDSEEKEECESRDSCPDAGQSNAVCNPSLQDCLKGSVNKVPQTDELNKATIAESSRLLAKKILQKNNQQKHNVPEHSKEAISRPTLIAQTTYSSTATVPISVPPVTVASNACSNKAMKALLIPAPVSNKAPSASNPAMIQILKASRPVVTPASTPNLISTQSSFIFLTKPSVVASAPQALFTLKPLPLLTSVSTSTSPSQKSAVATSIPSSIVYLSPSVLPTAGTVTSSANVKPNVVLLPRGATNVLFAPRVSAVTQSVLPSVQTTARNSQAGSHLSLSYPSSMKSLLHTPGSIGNNQSINILPVSYPSTIPPVLYAPQKTQPKTILIPVQKMNEQLINNSMLVSNSDKFKPSLNVQKKNPSVGPTVIKTKQDSKPVKYVKLVIGKDGKHYDKDTGKPYYAPKGSSIVILGKNGKCYDQKTGNPVKNTDALKKKILQKKDSSVQIDLTTKHRKKHDKTRKRKHDTPISLEKHQSKKRKKVKPVIPDDADSDSSFERMLASGSEEEDKDTEIDEDYDYEKISKRVKDAGKTKKVQLWRQAYDSDFEMDSDVESATSPVKLGRNAQRAAKGKSLNYAEISADSISAEESESEQIHEPCTVCNESTSPEMILMCDNCDAAHHTWCLSPPLMVLPLGDWICNECEHEVLIRKLKATYQRARKLLHRLNYDSCRRISSIDSTNIMQGRSGRIRKEVSYSEDKYDKIVHQAVKDLNQEDKSKEGSAKKKGKCEEPKEKRPVKEPRKGIRKSTRTVVTEKSTGKNKDTQSSKGNKKLTSLEDPVTESSDYECSDANSSDSEDGGQASEPQEESGEAVYYTSSGRKTNSTSRISKFL